MPGTIKLSRVTPPMGAASFTSYSMRYPLSTHWRRAACAEVECKGWRNGWQTVVDTSTDLGQRQYDYLVRDRSRPPRIEKTGVTQWTFSYGPGFPCFRQAEHRIKISRPPLLLRTGGDWRGNPRGTAPVVHGSTDSWAEDFSAHQDRLATLIKRG
jgi:hypothetical protein